MLLACTAAMSSCNKHRILRAETLELTQKIAEEDQKLRQVQAQLMSMGHLGQYENAGPQEMASLKSQVEGLVKEKEKMLAEIAREEAVLEDLKTNSKSTKANNSKRNPEPRLTL
jgi:hypothetical protein